MKTLVITGYDLKTEEIANVARYGQKVELHPDAKRRIKECRAIMFVSLV